MTGCRFQGLLLFENIRLLLFELRPAGFLSADASDLSQAHVLAGLPLATKIHSSLIASCILF